MSFMASTMHSTSPTATLWPTSASGLAPGALVIELNQRIIKQEEWAAVRLEPGDRIELLSFVGGG